LNKNKSNRKYILFKGYTQIQTPYLHKYADKCRKLKT